MTLILPTLPFPLLSAGAAEWSVDGDTLSVRSSPLTDYFIDPGYTEVPDEYTRLNADTALGALPDGDFVLSTQLTVGFTSDFDAGALILHRDDRHWAKLCFEYSREKQPMIVSVVAHEHCDDANAFGTLQDTFWLRIARMGHIIAFHASPDGKSWRMVRIFTFGPELPFTRIGFLAQSPNGTGCSVSFAETRFSTELPEDIRAGA